MARARTLKPGFFANDRLAACEPLGRLLFAGLWCHADREGRLEDRPRRLKAEILPYDDCDVDALLSQLERASFIERYVIGEDQYIAIPKFAEHQKPHLKEVASKIPAPIRNGRGRPKAIARAAQGNGEHQPGSVQDPEEPEAAAPSSVSLIPTPSVSPNGDTTSARALDSDFEIWWKDVWLKVGKGQARKAYRAARRKAGAQDVTAGRDRYTAKIRAENIEEKFQRHPATWLTGEGWLDEAPAPGPVLVVDAEVSRWELRAKDFAKDGFWPAMGGPRPGEPACQMPAAVLEKYGLPPTPSAALLPNPLDVPPFLQRAQA